MHWQKSVFYQWDVCVRRKANSYEEISLFKGRLEELKPLQCWISLAAASHNWKNYSSVLKYFQCCCRAFIYLLLGQFCLPWSTTTRWGSLSGSCSVPWKGGSWGRAEAKTSLWIHFLTEDANFMLLPSKFLLPEGDTLLLLSPLTCEISPCILVAVGS